MERQNYNDFANIKTARQKKKEEQDRNIRIDIDNINEAIEEDDENKLHEIHVYLDGKYSSYIPNWGMSTYGYNSKFGYSYEFLDKSSLIHNLSVFKAKLSGYLCDFDITRQSSSPMSNISVNVSNSNELTFNISFEYARKIIDEMPGLDDAATEEIKEKINELESISNEKIPKKKKWEKVKPILSFALDKGADVAITIMGLILQMKLGM